jgi:hypothetical protein
MDLGSSASRPIVVFDREERISISNSNRVPPLREEDAYSQAIAIQVEADTKAMERSAYLSANESSDEGEGDEELSFRPKKGNRRKLNEVYDVYPEQGQYSYANNNSPACLSVWSDARTSITSEETPPRTALVSSYSHSAATPLASSPSVTTASLGGSAFGAWNPPVETVAFDYRASAFSCPAHWMPAKRRRLDTYSTKPIGNGLEDSYKEAAKLASRHRLMSELCDDNSEPDGSDDNCTEDSNDSDLVVLSGLVARATAMLEDAVAHRSASHISNFLTTEDLRETISKEVYAQRGSFKTLPRRHVYTKATG